MPFYSQHDLNYFLMCQTTGLFPYEHWNRKKFLVKNVITVRQEGIFKNHKEIACMQIMPAWGLCLSVYVYCSLSECCVLHYTSVIKGEVRESFWQGVSQWLTVLPSQCEACAHCWPAARTLTLNTHTAQLPFNSRCYTSGQRGRIAVCLGVGLGECTCVCAHASIHVKCLLASHSPPASAGHSSSGRPPPCFHHAAWKSGK